MVKRNPNPKGKSKQRSRSAKRVPASTERDRAAATVTVANTQAQDAYDVPPSSPLHPRNLTGFWSLTVERTRREVVRSLALMGALDALLERRLTELRAVAALDGSSAGPSGPAKDSRRKDSGGEVGPADVAAQRQRRILQLADECRALGAEKLAVADNVAAGVRSIYAKIGKYR
jgi:hypothetical protein